MDTVITGFAIATVLAMIATFGLMAFSIDLEARGKRGQLSERVDALVIPCAGLTLVLLAVATTLQLLSH